MFPHVGEYFEIRFVLTGHNFFVQIFSFKVSTERKRIYASIDKLGDKFGSPTLDEITDVSRKLNAALEGNYF